LLKEQNSQLQKTIDEKLTKVGALEEELKKTRECKVGNEVQHFFGWNYVLLYFVIICDSIE